LLDGVGQTGCAFDWPPACRWRRGEQIAVDGAVDLDVVVAVVAPAPAWSWPIIARIVTKYGFVPRSPEGCG